MNQSDFEICMKKIDRNDECIQKLTDSLIEALGIINQLQSRVRILEEHCNLSYGEVIAELNLHGVVINKK